MIDRDDHEMTAATEHWGPALLLENLVERVPSAVVVVDVTGDVVTLANAAARRALGIDVGSAAARCSLEGAYLSLSSLAAGGLREPIVDEPIVVRARHLSVTTTVLDADRRLVALTMLDISSRVAQNEEQFARARLDMARTISTSLAARILDPCAVLTADLEFLRRSNDPGERSEALEEADAAMRRLTASVTAMREIALPPELGDGAPVSVSLDAAFTLVGSELGDVAVLQTRGTLEGVVLAPRPLVALALVQALLWIGERLRTLGRSRGPLVASSSADDAHVRIRFDHRGDPIGSIDDEPLGRVLAGLVRSVGGEILEGGVSGAAWTGIDLPVGSLQVSAPADRAMLLSGTLGRPILEREPAGPRSGRLHVLFIDDEAATRSAIGRSLSDELDLEYASNTEEALERIASRLPDVVLSDVGLTDTTGPTLMQAITGRWPALAGRFVFLTGGGIPSDDQRTIVAAGAPCLLKPVERSRLIDALRSVAGRP